MNEDIRKKLDQDYELSDSKLQEEEVREFVTDEGFDDYYANEFVNESKNFKMNLFLSIMDFYSLSTSDDYNNKLQQILSNPNMKQVANSYWNEQQEAEKLSEKRKEKATLKINRKNKLQQLKDGEGFIEVTGRYPISIELKSDILDSWERIKKESPRIRDYMKPLLLDSITEFKKFDGEEKIVLRVYGDGELKKGYKVRTKGTQYPIDGRYDLHYFYEVMEDGEKVQIETPHRDRFIVIEKGKIVNVGSLNRKISRYNVGEKIIINSI